MTYEWIGQGTPAGELFDPDAVLFEEGIRLQLHGEKVEIRPGSVVQLSSGDDGELWICRVESLFETAESEPQFRGRWFYGSSDLMQMFKECQNEEEERAVEELYEQLEDSELVLSNVEEDNAVASIMDVRTVKYESQTERKEQLFCRYCLDWDSEIKSFSVREIGDTDKSSSNEKESSQDDDDDNSQNTMSDDDIAHVMQEGEGSTLRGNIQVGDSYQASVKAFVPNQKVASRNPSIWWKPGCIAESDLQSFSDKLATVQTPFLLENSMTSDEPYTPLSTERVGELLKHFPEGETLTASHMSSASIAMGGNYSKLLKECDIDEVIKVLAEHDYNTLDALSAIQKDRERISSAWTATEREIFENSYRRNQGNLRVIAKDLMTKTMTQVVDYFYRFKIPDQFRLYQNKKREQAMYLMECIDRRRRGLPIPASKSAESDGEDDDDHAKARPSRWQETNVEETVHSVDRRRSAAKKLLLEVYSLLGQDTFITVATAVRKLRTSYDRSVKESLLLELKDHPELQRRFLDFLPRDV